MWRVRFKVLLPPLLLGFITLAAQAIFLRRFLWQVGTTEISVGLFLAAWLTWIGIGAGLAATRLGNRLVEALAVRLPHALLWYLPLLCVQIFLIEHVRALIGVSAYVTPPLDRLLLGALVVNAPVAWATGLLFPATAGWLTARGGSAALAYACDTAGGIAAGILVTVLLAVGMPLDGGHIHDWQRLFPGTRPDGAFATSAGTYLHGLRGDTFYVVSAGHTVEMLPEQEQSSDVATLLLARVPDARHILLLGRVPLAVALALLEFQPQAHVVWCHDDPAYARKVATLARKRLGIEVPVKVPPVGPQQFLAAGGIDPFEERFDLVVVWPADASTAAGAALYEPSFLRQVAAALQPGGVAALPLRGGGVGSWSQEQRHFASRVMAQVRQVWPGQGLLAPGAGGWWLAGQGNQPAPAVADLTSRFSRLHVGRMPDAAVAGLYDSERSAEMLRFCAVDRVLSILEPGGLQFLGLACALHAEWPAWPLACQLEWLARHAGAGLLLLLLGALWLTPAACGKQEAGAWRLALAWLAAESFMGLAGLLTFMRSLEIRFGDLYLLAALASCLYLGGVFAGNRLAERTRRHWVGGRWLPAVTVFHGFLLWSLTLLVSRAASPLMVAGACLLAGVPVGAAVSAAAAEWGKLGLPARMVGALLARGDAWGSAVGGFVCSLFLLPWLGGSQTCLAAFGFAAGVTCVTSVNALHARTTARSGLLACLLLMACLTLPGASLKSGSPAPDDSAFPQPGPPMQSRGDVTSATHAIEKTPDGPPMGHTHPVNLLQLRQSQSRGGLSTNAAAYWEYEE